MNVEAIYNRSRLMMVKKTVLRGFTPSEAEDLVQGAFLRLLETPTHPVFVRYPRIPHWVALQREVNRIRTTPRLSRWKRLLSRLPRKSGRKQWSATKPSCPSAPKPNGGSCC